MKFLASVFAERVAVRADAEARPVRPAVHDARWHDRAPAGPALRLDGDARRLSGRHPNVPRVVEITRSMTHSPHRGPPPDPRRLLDVSHRETPQDGRACPATISRPTRRACRVQVERFIEPRRRSTRQPSARSRPPTCLPPSRQAAALHGGVRTSRRPRPTSLQAWLTGEGACACSATPSLTNEQIEIERRRPDRGGGRIAQTGTIVLDGGPGQGRRASPPSRTTTSASFATTRSWVWSPKPSTLLHVDALKPGQPITWISGPSATSDIELNRVEGSWAKGRSVLVSADPRDELRSREGL